MLQAVPVRSQPVMALADLLGEARVKNPAIKAARKKWELSQALIIPARTPPQPVLGVQREDMPADNERSVHYSVEQEIPFPGKLATESRMKFHEAAQAEEEFRDTELSVLSAVKSLYHRMAWLTSTAAALRRDAEIVRAIARAAESRVAGGGSGAEEALMAQARLKDIENAVFEREEQAAIEEEGLNALLAAPPGARRDPAAAAPVRELSYSAEELAAMAKETSPVFRGSVHELHHAHLMTRRGRLGFAPDFKLSYEQEVFRRKASETMVGASMSIPLWFWKPLGEYRSAKAHTDHAMAMSSEKLAMVFKELAVERIEVRLHARLANRYASEIIPLSEGALNIALKNYETGKADFAKLSEAVRMLLDARMRYYEAVYHHGEHWAMLERVVGREIPAGK